MIKTVKRWLDLQDMAVREDLRGLTVCSVDPPGCTDIDDALHCRTLENGNLEVTHTHTPVRISIILHVLLNKSTFKACHVNQPL